MSETIRYVQGFIQPPRRGGELPLKQIYSPPEKGPSTPPRGELWRPADMPSRPLQVNLLLQHETEGIHTTNN